MFELLRAAASSGSEPAPAPQLRSRLSRLYARTGARDPSARSAACHCGSAWSTAGCDLRPRRYTGAEVDRLDAHRFIDALALHDDPQRLVGEALGELTERLYSGAPPQPGRDRGHDGARRQGTGVGRGDPARTRPQHCGRHRSAAALDRVAARRRGHGSAAGADPRHDAGTAVFVGRLYQAPAARTRAPGARAAAVRRGHARAQRAASAGRAAATGQPGQAAAAARRLTAQDPVAGDRRAIPGARSPSRGRAGRRRRSPTQPSLWRLPQTWSLPRPPAPPAVQRLRARITHAGGGAGVPLGRFYRARSRHHRARRTASTGGSAQDAAASAAQPRGRRPTTAPGSPNSAWPPRSRRRPER